MQQITTDEYIEKLNDELKKHKEYKNGMAIFSVPKGATGKNVTGFHFDGVTHTDVLVFSEVITIVSKKYTIFE